MKKVLRILLVENDWYIIKMLIGLLKGFEVVVATSVKEAELKYKANPDFFAIVLCGMVFANPEDENAFNNHQENVIVAPVYVSTAPLAKKLTGDVDYHYRGIVICASGDSAVSKQIAENGGNVIVEKGYVPDQLVYYKSMLRQ